MTGYHDEILTEVRKRKTQLLEKYGGIDGFHKHIDAERAHLEKEGWTFLNIDEVREKNYCRQIKSEAQ